MLNYQRVALRHLLLYVTYIHYNTLYSKRLRSRTSPCHSWINQLFNSIAIFNSQTASLPEAIVNIVFVSLCKICAPAGDFIGTGCRRQISSSAPKTAELLHAKAASTWRDSWRSVLSLMRWQIDIRPIVTIPWDNHLYLVGGWALPLWKNMKVSWDDEIPNGKIKNVPDHPSDIVTCLR